jgi:hypothetical protein
MVGEMRDSQRILGQSGRTCGVRGNVIRK